jgi:hypothetical protein
MRRIIRGGVAALVAVVSAVAVTAGPAAAGTALYATGLTFPSGAIIDPAGRVWAADHLAGFCRIVDPTPTSAGFIEHPQFPGDTGHGQPTCLGGLLAGAGPGADATSTPSFVDPTPGAPGSGDEIVLVPDGAAPSSEVFRFRWNPTTGRFDLLDTVSMIGARVRPNASSLGPDGNVYVVFQKAGEVQRIVNPASIDPANPPTVEIVGRTSDGVGAAGIAAGRDSTGAVTVYFGDAIGLAALHPNPVTPPGPVPAPFDMAGGAPNTMAYDNTRDLLYVGTANAAVAGDRVDVVHRFGVIDAGATMPSVSTGYSIVAGIGIRPDGHLLVVDDDAALLGGVEGGTGRMFLVGPPASTITAGPPALTNIAQPVIQFTGDGPATFECAVDGAAFTPCTSPFSPASPLTDAPHVFAVRAVIGTETGVPATRSFTVDTTPPTAPTVTAPTDGAVTNARPVFGFAAEAGAVFACNFDGAGFAACAAGATQTFDTAPGAHTIQVTATDAAGNTSAPSALVTFTVDVTGPDAVVSSPAEGAPTGTSPAFVFASPSADAARFECRLDQGAFAACVSPVGFAGIAGGTHVFAVRAIDNVGNVGPAASRTIHVLAGAPAPGPPPVGDTGYWLFARDGGVFSFGNAPFLGSTGGMRLNQPVVSMAKTPTGLGYWMAASDGGVFSFGDAQFFGSTGARRLNQPVVGIAPTPSGRGYWLVARDGGVFSFGDAQFFGSTGAMRLNAPILSMVPTPSGLGYWLLAADGGVFSFGDARFFGSTGALRLNRPVVAMARTPSGLGYWLVAADGGIFTFGDAAFNGSAAAFGPVPSIAGIATTPSGAGYWIVGNDGAVFAFGDAQALGGLSPQPLRAPVLGLVGNR